MSITEIETAIRQLPPSDLNELRRWLEDYRPDSPDRDVIDEFEGRQFESLIANAYASGDPSPLTQQEIDEARRVVKHRIAERNQAR